MTSDIFICFYILYNVKKHTQNRYWITESQKKKGIRNLSVALHSTVRRCLLITDERRAARGPDPVGVCAVQWWVGNHTGR